MRPGIFVHQTAERDLAGVLGVLHVPNLRHAAAGPGMHTHTHTRTRTHAHTHTNAHTHTHKHKHKRRHTRRVDRRRDIKTER